MAGVYDNCAVCAVKLTHPPGRGNATKYCSQDCNDVAAAKRRESKQHPTCCIQGCGDPATRVSAQMCEKHYYRVRRNGTIEPRIDVAKYSACQHCGADAGGLKHCSTRCSTRASWGVPHLISCVNCQKEFAPFDRWLCCSPECKKAHRRKQGKAFYAANIHRPEFAAKVRANEYRRKARKRGAFVEHVDRDAVMRRDKWKCHLCGEPIPKGAKWPNGMFGTLDHVVPLAAGGQHGYDNVKAAHLSCNCSKGAKTIGQLGLGLTPQAVGV